MDVASLSLEEIQNLKRQLEEKEKEKFEEFRGQAVLGFKLSLVYSTQKNGKKYSAWKAYLCYKGKRHVAHVGKDPRIAKQKIIKYIKNHSELGCFSPNPRKGTIGLYHL